MSLTKLLEVVIPGQPIGKGRARASIRNIGGRARVAMHTPEKTVRWESHAAHVIALVGADPQSGPVVLQIEARFERPQRLLTKRAAALRNVPHVSKPDADNISKAVCDAMEKSGLVHNDCQAYGVSVRKLYADAGQAPGVMVQVFVPVEG